MLVDLTTKVEKSLFEELLNKSKTRIATVGHIGTHFDVMDKVFPLDFAKRKGIVFDVSTVKDRDIDIIDIDLDKVKKDTFVAFYTGFIEKYPYGTEDYFKLQPQ